MAQVTVVWLLNVADGVAVIAVIADCLMLLPVLQCHSAALGTQGCSTESQREHRARIAASISASGMPRLTSAQPTNQSQSRQSRRKPHAVSLRVSG